jgi:hypothetical protein
MGVGELPVWFLGCRDTRIPRIQLASAEAKLTTNHRLYPSNPGSFVLILISSSESSSPRVLLCHP